jgi:dephospho-CoA kinase
MKIIGLTGSIGMGKTTTSAMFAQLGVPIWDADSAVHRLYDVGGAAVKAVAALFPSALSDNGTINRADLAKLVLNDPDQLKKLEAIVHPLVGKDRSDFMSAARDNGTKIAIVDVPLLFETGGDVYVDKVVVVTCAPELQRQRVLARPGMSSQKFEAILARQTPDAAKRAKADFIITTDVGLDDTRQQVRHVYDQLMEIGNPSHA